MKQVVFVSREKERFAELELMLTRYDVTVEWCTTGKTLFTLLANTQKGKWIDLVIMEEVLPDTDAVSLVKALTPQSPMTHCVVAGTMKKKEFHDAFEGYGVLMQLPPQPEAADAQTLEAHLKKIGAIHSR